MACEQWQKLQSIEEELEEVKRRLGRIWHAIETTDIEMADASDRIKEHRERKEKLEVAADEARMLLSERRALAEKMDTIAAVVEEMSELTELTDQGLCPVLRQGDRGQARQGRYRLLHTNPGRLSDRWIGRRGGGSARAGYEFGASWWARQGSNLRPIGYEPTALPLSYEPDGTGWSSVSTGSRPCQDDRRLGRDCSGLVRGTSPHPSGYPLSGA